MNDQSTERAVLGSLLVGMDPHEAVTTLDESCFTSSENRAVWQACVDVFHTSSTVSASSVFDRLERQGRTDLATRLHSFASVGRSQQRLTSDVHRLVEFSRRRKVKAEAERLAQAAADMSQDLDKTLDGAVEAMLSDDTGQRGLITVEDVWDDVVTEIRGGRGKGESTGWKAVDRLYTVQPGWVTLVSGIPGAGKSEWVNNLAVNLASRGWRFVMFSPEASPASRHIADLVHTYLGRLPSEDDDEPDRTKAMSWVDDRFVWMDDLRDNTLDGILARARVAVRRRDVKGVVIDPWNKVRHGYGNQRQDLYLQDALGQLTRLARLENVHVWIVAHPKQMRREDGTETRYEPVRAYDVSGGAEWFNQTDCMISLWRDQHGERQSPEETTVYVQKVRREGEWGKRGNCDIRFIPAERRFVDKVPT